MRSRRCRPPRRTLRASRARARGGCRAMSSPSPRPRSRGPTMRPKRRVPPSDPSRPVIVRPTNPGARATPRRWRSSRPPSSPPGRTGAAARLGAVAALGVESADTATPGPDVAALATATATTSSAGWRRSMGSRALRRCVRGRARSGVQRRVRDRPLRPRTRPLARPRWIRTPGRAGYPRFTPLGGAAVAGGRAALGACSPARPGCSTGATLSRRAGSGCSRR